MGKKVPASSIVQSCPLHLPGTSSVANGVVLIRHNAEVQRPQGLGDGALRQRVSRQKLAPHPLPSHEDKAWLNRRREGNAIALLANSTRVHPSTAAARLRAQLASSSHLVPVRSREPDVEEVNHLFPNKLTPSILYIQMFSWGIMQCNWSKRS